MDKRLREEIYRKFTLFFNKKNKIFSQFDVTLQVHENWDELFSPALTLSLFFALGALTREPISMNERERGESILKKKLALIIDIYLCEIELP